MSDYTELRDQLIAELKAAQLNASRISKADESVDFRSATEFATLFSMLDALESQQNADYTTLARRVRL